MSKNIVVFSDGTGQEGGLREEQRLSNVYKLYRVCRVGPNSGIDPCEQVAFYDPGLGTDGSATGFIGAYRRLQKLLSLVTGLGITKNIADCYEFIVNQYEPGDRIFFVGFSLHLHADVNAASNARGDVPSSRARGPRTAGVGSSTGWCKGTSRDDSRSTCCVPWAETGAHGAPPTHVSTTRIRKEGAWRGRLPGAGATRRTGHGAEEDYLLPQPSPDSRITRHTLAEGI